jgi:hypothetical protein
MYCVKRNVPDAAGFKQVIRDFKMEFGQHRLDFVIVCILSHGIFYAFLGFTRQL